MSRNNTRLDDDNIICPVCKSSRYLNVSLTFLINPECYHEMCSTCVDRIFTSGPASCPVPHCGKTLRKKGFHKAFFDDLKIEREVDVRKRVGKIFNKRQDEFESLRDWNDYLETVEDLVFDIVEGSKASRIKAENVLIEFAERNKGDIEENRRAQMEEAELGKLQEQAQKNAAVQRRMLAFQAEQDEKADLVKSQREMLDRLANTDEDANAIAMQAKRIILKKSSARRNLAETREDSTGDGLTIRGLKKKEKPVEEKPYDPFGGIDLTPMRYAIQEDYPNEWLNQAKRDFSHTAGGYSIKEYTSRAMFEAFSGLGVFVEEEVGTRDQSIPIPLAPLPIVPMKPQRIKIKVKQEEDDIF